MAGVSKVENISRAVMNSKPKDDWRVTVAGSAGLTDDPTSDLLQRRTCTPATPIWSN